MLSNTTSTIKYLSVVVNDLANDAATNNLEDFKADLHLIEKLVEQLKKSQV